MTWRDEIDMEIRRQAIRLYPDCAALFERNRQISRRMDTHGILVVERFATFHYY